MNNTNETVLVDGVRYEQVDQTCMHARALLEAEGKRIFGDRLRRVLLAASCGYYVLDGVVMKIVPVTSTPLEQAEQRRDALQRRLATATVRDIDNLAAELADVEYRVRQMRPAAVGGAA